MTIIRNSAHCSQCGEDIESKHRHDFVSCKCGNIMVDGGHAYLRRVGGEKQWEDTSLVTKDEDDALSA